MPTSLPYDNVGPRPEHAGGKRMTEERLRSIVDANIRQSIGYVGGETSEDRRRAMEFYLGEPLGNEVDGRSQIVSTDVQDAVEAMMPALMEIFAGTDRLVEFEPTGPEDVDLAKQATDYVNHVWMHDNPGYEIIHNWVKDALLQKNGIIKIFWDDQQTEKRETFENLNSLLLQELADDPDVEIIEFTEVEVPVDFQDIAPDGVLYDVTVLRTYKNGRVKIMGVPPEDFLISRRSLSLDDAEFTCHKCKKTVTDLIEMGFDEDLVRDIPSHDEQDYNEERVARYDKDDEWPDWDTNLDPTMREVWVYDCYMKIDYDGDGTAEMRQIMTAGSNYLVLSNEPVDEHPFCDITPIQMPHKFFGRSIAELIEDIQVVKSTLEREVLNNAYTINNNRHAINERVDLDSWFNNAAGTPVLVEGERPPGEAIEQVASQPLPSWIYQVIEYLDISREERTGITRLDQGMDPDSLNQTATGINLLLGRTQQRMLFTARTMANRGFKAAAQKILRLLVAHQDFPRVIRLRNEWVEMEPQHWNISMDVTVKVGLGAGTREQKLGQVQAIKAAQAEAVALQGGQAMGPLVTYENLYNTAEALVNSVGFPDVRPFFQEPDPQQIQQMAQQPDPEMQKAQAEMEMKQQEFQAEMQLKVQEAQAEMQLEREKMNNEIQLMWAKANAEANVQGQKLQLETEKTAADIQLKQQDKVVDLQVKREQMQNDNRLASEKQVLDASKEGAIPDVLVTKDKVEEMREEVTVATQQIAEASSAMARVAEQMAQMAQLMAAPTRLVRDENGRVVGSEKAVG